jgi:hypothetical protein
MLNDGLTARQADGSASEKVEIVDVAQMLLESVKRKPEPKPVPLGTPSLSETSEQA